MSACPSLTPEGHVRFSTSARLSRPHKSKCASECVIFCVSDLNWCLRPHTSSCAEGACVCQSAHVCVCVAGPGRAAALSVQSVTLWHRRLFHVPPGPGEAVSGQGARSQGSHTAAHCPGLRAASQRQGGGGWPLGPRSGDMFLGPWGWQLEVAAQREPVPPSCPRRGSVGGRRLR